MPISSKCPSPSTITTTNIDKGAGEEIWTNLLAPLKRGKFNLSHRVVLAPVTRCRALDYVPQLAHVEFYAKRATFGGLLITEAVAVAQEAIGYEQLYIYHNFYYSYMHACMRFIHSCTYHSLDLPKDIQSPRLSQPDIMNSMHGSG